MARQRDGQPLPSHPTAATEGIYAAFAGEVGCRRGCSNYEGRPGACRRFEAGGVA